MIAHHLIVERLEEIGLCQAIQKGRECPHYLLLDLKDWLAGKDCMVMIRQGQDFHIVFGEPLPPRFWRRYRK